MKITRRGSLIALLLAGIASWGVLLAVEYSFREPDNWSRIEDKLYMGGFVQRPPRGTKAALNLCESEDPYRCDVHSWKPIPDREPAPSLRWLWDRVMFIDDQQRAGLRTYVHCRAGISRSGMVVVAYLMYRNKWTRDDALADVRTKRPDVRPNVAFMRLLLEWEKYLKDKN
jgi:hypothetical protein